MITILDVVRQERIPLSRLTKQAYKSNNKQLIGIVKDRHKALFQFLFDYNEDLKQKKEK